jgi:hypothetical protein
MTTLFSEGEQTNNSPPPVDEDKNWFEELVGEGKKYKDSQALAKARVEADNFIEVLKRENADLRNQAKMGLTLEQFMEKMKQERQTQGNQSANGGNQDSNQNQGGTPNNEGARTLTEQDIERVVTEREQRREAERNVNEVKRLMSEKWGNNYVSKLEAIVSDTGITREDLDALAQKSPKAFARFTGLDTQATTQPPAAPSSDSLFTPPRSNVNSDATRPSGTGEHNQTWWDAVRKKDRAFYYSDEGAKQRHRDAMQLKERFFS